MGAFCCDGGGLYPIGGQLYQWDQCREVTVPPGFAQVHFTKDPENKRTSWVMEAKDGKAAIPNELLQDAGYLYAYLSDGKRTYDKAKWRVIERPMPGDYVYKPSEVLGLETIHEWIREELAQYGDYDNLTNKPSLEGVTLSGDLTLEDLGVTSISSDTIHKLFTKE